MQETQEEMPDISFVCPYCGSDLEAAPQDSNRTWYTCPHCAEVLSLASQRAYDRAVANYHFAQELVTPELVNENRRPNQFSPQSKDALRAYQKAYTGIQLALKAQLPAGQLMSAIEMMADTARILQAHEMISVLEARYWVQLMVCQTARQELEGIRERLKEPRPNLLTRLLRYPHWRLRLGQLRRALKRRHKRLHEMEQTLAFVDDLHVTRPER